MQHLKPEVRSLKIRQIILDAAEETQATLGGGTIQVGGQTLNDSNSAKA
ncbi:MAG: hypothetical protein RI559_13830 [Marinospirillum sp.]|nr:hypothetical protein [Marinospirillum sp.]